MLNQDHRDALGLKLTELAVIYSHELPRERAKIFIDVLCKYFTYPIGRYLAALDAYVSDSKNKRFPSPMDLRPYLEPELSIESQANDIASKIRSAISRFGWPNANDAMAYIGEAGWTVVSRAGGWNYLCENLGVDLNPLTFHAQARDLAKSILEEKKIQIQHEQLGYSGNPIKELNFAMKEIPK